MVLKTISVGSDYRFESNIQGMNANGQYEGTAMFGTGTPYNRFVSMTSTFKEDSSQLIIDRLLGYYEGSYFLSDKKFIIDDFDLKKLRKDVALKSKSIFIHFKVSDDTFTFRHLKFNINGNDYYFKTKQAHLKNVRGVMTYTVNPYQTTVMFTKDDLRDHMSFTLQFKIPDAEYRAGITSMKLTEFRTSNNCRIILDIDTETIIFPLPLKYELRSKSEIKSNIETEYPDEFYKSPRSYMRPFDLISPYSKFNKWYSLNLYITKDPTLSSFIPSISLVYENVANTFSKLQNPEISDRIISLGCVYYYDDVVDDSGPFFFRFKNHPILPIFSNHTLYVENRYKFLDDGAIPTDIADLIQQGYSGNGNGGGTGYSDGGNENIDPTLNLDENGDPIDGDNGLTDEIQGNMTLSGLIFPTELLLVQHDYDYGTNCMIYPRSEYAEYKVFDRALWGQADFNEISYDTIKADELIVADCEYPFIIWNEKDEYVKSTDDLAINDSLDFNWSKAYGGTEGSIVFNHGISLKDQWTGTWIGFRYTRGNVAVIQKSTTTIDFGDNFLLPVTTIETPALISDTIDVDTTADMLFELTPYIAINHNQFHARTDWIISTSNDPDSVDDHVINIVDDTDNLTTLIVPALELESNSNLYIMVRYKSTAVTSNWSITNFNTKYQILKPSENIINTWNAPNLAISGITYMRLPEGDMGFVTSDYSAKNIYIHDGKEAFIRDWFPAPGDGIVTGVTNDGNGNLISCNGSNNTIYIHDGVSSTILSSFSGPGTSISDITIDSSGNLISCDSEQQQFYIHVGISATVTNQFKAPEVNPRGITFFYGMLYITSVTADKIYGIDPADWSGTTIPYTEIQAPSTYPTGLSHTNSTLLSTDLDDRAIYEHDTII